MAARAGPGRLRLHRPPGHGRGRARRLERPEPGRPVPRPLHLRRPRARAQPRRDGLRRRRPARARGPGARARPARCRGARHLRRARAQPALRPPLRLPAGRRHPQAPQPAPRRPPAQRRRRERRGRDARLRARRRRCARGARSASPATRRPRSPSARSSSPTASPRTCWAWAWTTRPPPAGCAWSISRAHDPGRDEAVQTLAGILRHPSSLPVVLAGPDAESLAAKAYGRPLVVVHVRDIDGADVMAEAALISALEERPIVFEGMEDLEPGDRGRMLRAIERRGERVVVCAPEPQRRARAGRPHVPARRGRAAELRRARDGVVAGLRHGGHARRRREVPALHRADPRGRGGRQAGRRGPRRADPRARRARPRRTPGVVLAARGARHADPARVHVGRPRGARPPARAARLDQRLPAPPRPRALRVGLREDGRALAGPEGPLRGRVRHGQDDVGPGAGGRARPRALPRRPGDHRLQVHRGDGEEPRPHLQRGGGLQRDPLLRRGGRAVRQALGDLGLPRPLREHRGRLPPAEDGGLPRRGHPRDELPAQHRRRVRAPARLRHRLPVPRGRRPRADLGAGAARVRRRSPTTSTCASWPRTSSCRAARSRTARSPPRSRPPTTAT